MHSYKYVGIYLVSSYDLLEIRNGPYRTNNNIIEQKNFNCKTIKFKSRCYSKGAKRSTLEERIRRYKLMKEVLLNYSLRSNI